VAWSEGRRPLVCCSAIHQMNRVNSRNGLWSWWQHYKYRPGIIINNNNTSNKTANVAKLLLLNKHPVIQSFVVLSPRPCVGSGVVRIDRLRFLAGCRTRRLNQALTVLSLSLGFLWLRIVLLTRDSFFRLFYFYVISVFYSLVVLVMLSVPVQVIDWKDSSPKWPIMCWRGR